MTENKYIILDRDGVINYDSSAYIKKAHEWNPISKSLEALNLLTQNQYKIIIISNQAGVSRGIINYSDSLAIHKKFINSCSNIGASIYLTYYCFDHPDSNSINRKPKPGMYLEISQRLNLDLTDVFAIGDSPRDMEAALSSGCKPLGVRTGNGEEISNSLPSIDMFDCLYDAAQFVIDYDKQYILNI